MDAPPKKKTNKIRVGDVVRVEVEIKKQTERVWASIKWRGAGKLRINVDGQPRFIEEGAILENFGRNITVKQAKKQWKKDKKTRQWINIHFVGGPNITEKNELNKLHISMTGAATYETAAVGPNRVDPKKDETPQSAIEVEDDGKDDEKDDYKQSNATHSAAGSTDLSALSTIGGMSGMDRGRSQSGPIPTSVISQLQDDVQAVQLDPKYEQMVRLGMPSHAISNKMRLDGISQNQIDAFFNVQSRGTTVPTQRSQPSPIAPMPPNPRMEKFERMRRMGMPMQAIINVMRIQGISAEDIAQFENR